MRLLLVVLQVLPLCVYGRFGRYGEVIAPGPQPKSLSDEVAIEDDGRFSDSDADVTAVKDEDFQACFLTKYDKEWDLDFDEKHDVTQTVEPGYIKTSKDLEAFQELVGPVIASMCKKMTIYWLLDSNGSPLPLGSSRNQNGPVLDLPIPERIPVPQRLPSSHLPVPQKLPSSHLPVPHKLPSSHLPVPQKLPSSHHSSIHSPANPHRTPEHHQSSNSLPVPRPIHSHQSHGSLTMPIPHKLPSMQHSQGPMKLPVPIRRPQNHGSSIHHGNPMAVPEHIRPGSEVVPPMQVFRHPYLIPRLQSRGRPYARPPQKLMKAAVRSGSQEKQPYLVPESPNSNAPRMQRTDTK